MPLAARKMHPVFTGMRSACEHCGETMLKLLPSMLLSAAAFTAQATPVSVNALLGAPVLDTQGKRLGILRDLALDVENESVAYAIVDYRDPAVPSVDLRPVALSDLRPALAPGSLVLDSNAGGGGSAVPQDDARLRRASTLLGMNIEHPSGADYGVIEDIVVELDSARVPHAVVRLDAGVPAAERDIPFAALRFPEASRSALLTLQQGLTEVSGEVTQRWRASRPDGTPHDMMRVRTDDGRSVLVDLGAPGGEATIAQGDRVTVKGAPTSEAGERALFAHYVLRHTR
jgi:sporulation protein YlmC with PRC-barrel domain